MFDYDLLFTTFVIVLARMTDVSLGVIRTVAVVNGRKFLALGLGFFEVLVWVLAVSRVVTSLGEPAYAVSYALGFALGNFVGILIEQRLAFGEQILRVFTRRGAEVAAALRADGFTVTSMQGEGLDGPIHLLMVQAERKRMRGLADRVEHLDADCFYVVDDVRMASSARRRSRGSKPRVVPV